MAFDDGVIYSNRAECYLKLEKHLAAKLDAQKAFGLAVGSITEDSGAFGKKAAWRLGKACLALGDHSQAAAAAANGLRRFHGDAALRQLANDAELARRKAVS